MYNQQDTDDDEQPWKPWNAGVFDVQTHPCGLIVNPLLRPTLADAPEIMLL